MTRISAIASCHTRKSRWPVGFNGLSPTPATCPLSLVTERLRRSITIVLRLVRAFPPDADIARLRVGQFGELRCQFPQLQPRDFLVEVLGQDVHAHRVL